MSTDSPLFQKLHQSSKRVSIDGVTYWVVEGDTLLDEDQLLLYGRLSIKLCFETSEGSLKSGLKHGVELR